MIARFFLLFAARVDFMLCVFLLFDFRADDEEAAEWYLVYDESIWWVFYFIYIFVYT